MDLSGSQFRSIAESTDFSFSSDFSLAGLTGLGEFSLSGQNNKIKFDFESGKIFDNENNYIRSYSNNETISISGDVSSNGYSYYINSEPFALGASKPNFKLQKVCFESTGLSFSNVATEIRGTKPDYYITFPETFVASGYHTGHIVNDSASLGFRVLGVDVVGDYNTYWSVTEFDKDILPNNSGKIVVQDLSGSPVYHTGEYKIKVNTNFGPIQTGVSGYASPSSFRNVNFSVKKTVNDIPKSGIDAKYSHSDTRYNSYLISYSAFSGFEPSGDRQLSISLEYSSGTTGDFFGGPSSRVLGTGQYVREMYRTGSYDFFNQATVITGYKTGEFSGIEYVIGSGEFGQYSERKLLSFESHTGNFLSGYTDANLLTLVHASGVESNSKMTGVNTLSPSDNKFIATGSGILTEYYNGTWNYTPGAYVATTGELTGLFSGIDIVASDLGDKHYSAYVTGSDTGTTIYSEDSFSWYADLFNEIKPDGNVGTGSVRSVDPSHAASGITGVTVHSGLWTGDVMASGETFYSDSGQYSGYLTGYTKSFTGLFNLYTGAQERFDYYKSGVEYGSYIWGPHGNIGLGAGAGNVGVYTGYKTATNLTLEGSGASQEAVHVSFTTPFDYEPVVAVLTISGIDGNVYTDTITGAR